MDRTERQCPECGEVLGRSSRFCPACGHRVRTTDEDAEERTEVAVRPALTSGDTTGVAGGGPSAEATPAAASGQPAGAPAEPDDWPAAVQDQLVAPTDALPDADDPARPAPRRRTRRPPRRPTAEQVAYLQAAARAARDQNEQLRGDAAPLPDQGPPPEIVDNTVPPPRREAGRLSAADMIESGVLELETTGPPRRPTPAEPPEALLAAVEPYAVEPSLSTRVGGLFAGLPSWVWLLVLATALGLVAIVVVETTTQTVSYGGPWRPAVDQSARREAERLFLKGREHLQAKRYTRAAKAFRAALVTDPSYTRAHIGLGVIFAARDRRQKALAEFRRYLEASPDGPDAELARTLIQVHGGGEEEP